MKALCESERYDYYKPIRIGKASNNKYIEYESNADKNKTTSIQQYFGLLLKDFRKKCKIIR